MDQLVGVKLVIQVLKNPLLLTWKWISSSCRLYLHSCKLKESITESL